MSHLKRISAPKTWPLARKDAKFVIRPNAGKVHELSLPLGYILKDMLPVCDTLREVKVLLSHRKVLANGKIRRDYKYPVGLYDVITVDDISYRVVIAKNGKLAVNKIDAKEKDSLLLQITSKKLVVGGKFHLGFFGGHSIILDSAKEYSVGDSVVVDGKGKISKHIPMKKGALIQFIGGKHIGAKGTVESIDDQKIIVKIGDLPTETLKTYAFVVGEKTEVLTL